MGRFCLAVVVLLFSAGSCPAQRLVVGEKAPELKVGEWLLHKDALSDSRPTLVEFFFSRSEPSLRRLTVLDGFIRDHSERLNVILMVRESRERLPRAAVRGRGKDVAGRERLRLYCGARRREPDVRGLWRAICSFRRAVRRPGAGRMVRQLVEVRRRGIAERARLELSPDFPVARRAGGAGARFCPG